MLEVISSIPVVGGVIATVLPFVLVLGIVVFVHEYGHYIVGRWCGIKAEVFSLGFGPVLTSWVDRRGTKWQVAALPLGGYVKFLGDVDGSSRGDPKLLDAMAPEARAHAFHGAAVWKRMLTVAAGPVFNFILSFVVFTLIFFWQGIQKEPPTIGEIQPVPRAEQITLQVGDIVRAVEGEPVQVFSDIARYAAGLDTARDLTLTVERDGQTRDVTAPYPIPPLVLDVTPLSPASRAGLRSGDYIQFAGERELFAFADLLEVVTAAGQTPIALKVWREGTLLDVTLTPQMSVVEDGEGGLEERPLIGVHGGGAAYSPERVVPGVGTALWAGAAQMVRVVEMTFKGLAHIIRGEISANNIQGPLGIAQVSGETASKGAINLVFLVAVISLTIGLLNLFPIPILDGGHLVIFTYEAITGRPPADVVLQVAMSLGLAMVLLLMVFATYNDVMRLLFVS